MKRISLPRTAAILALLLVLGSSLPGCRQSPKTPPVKIGYLPIYVDLPLFVAEEEGFFKRHGVDVELVRFAASPEIGTALTTGGADVGASIAFSVALSNESRDPGQLKIFIVDSENKTNYLSSFVARPGANILRVEDLKGKTLGVFPGPTAVTFCRLILEKHGINPDTDLKFVELPVASHVPALQSGTVDAVFTYEPTGTQAVMELGAVSFLPAAVESEIMSPWQAGVWVMSTRWATAHPNEANAVTAALYDAVDFIARDPRAAKNALSKFTSIKLAVAEKTPNIPFAKGPDADLNALQRQENILFERKIVSKQISVGSLMAPTQWSSSVRP
jgi:NitT/TauT family transport system substrate-binding protein